MTKRVIVLLGGPSSEREVSLISGRACAQALERKGYEVHCVDTKVERWVEDVKRLAPDIVFNALHGPWGEDGRVQGVLEWLGTPYTHSGVLASALAMDKTRAKMVFRDVGIDCPHGLLVRRGDLAERDSLPAPYVVKPNDQGSSVGVIIALQAQPRPLEVTRVSPEERDEIVLVEEFIAGRELTVAVMEDRALGVTEIVTDAAFYDFDAKYVDGGSRHVLPADLPPAVYEQCLNSAVSAHQALGCKGLTRSDFRYDPEKDRLALLEVNTQPGMTSTSLAPEQAAHVGIGFDDLVSWIAENASCLR